MNKPAILLTLGIIVVLVVYLYYGGGSVLFPLDGGWLYFSNTGFILLNSAIIISAAAFFIAYSKRKDGPKRKSKSKANLYLIIVIAMSFILIGFGFIGGATMATVAGIMLTALFAKKFKSRKFYAVVAIGIILTAASAYLLMIPIKQYRPAVDETAFNYYASYLVIHGLNPYTTSMQPIMAEYNITPTLLLNGSSEYKYNYPALSFISTIFMPLTGQYSPNSFIIIVTLMTAFAAFFIYYKSKYNKIALIPIAVWIFATYIGIGTIDQYLAVAVFLLVAYTERKNLMLSSIFLGLAASTIQLAWFALPFLLILTLREQGTKKFYKSVLIVLAVFLIINSYFILLAPKPFLGDMLSIFGSSKLVPGGPNLALLLIHSYPVPLWYDSLVPIVTLLAFIGLFYLYTATLKPLLAIVPALIFFLSWRNLIMYALAFIPIIIVMCYLNEKDAAPDLLKSKKLLVLAVLLLVITFAVLLAYAHMIYIKQDTLSINSIIPAITRNSSNLQISYYSINGISLNLSNNGNSYESVSFLVLNRYPVKYQIIRASGIGATGPRSDREYNLNLSFQSKSDNTSIYVIAYSQDYIIAKEFHIRFSNNSK